MKTIKKKEKVLLYVIQPVTMTYIRGELAEYTKYNGCYPDFIDMPEEIFNYAQSLLLAPVELKTLYGIPVRKI